MSSRTPKPPLARESHVLLEEHWALGWDSSAAPPLATCRKKHKLEETALNYPSSTPRPTWVLHLPSPGELPGTSEYFPGGGEGGNSGHRYEALPTLPSVVLVHVLPHRQILGGEQLGRRHFLPLQKGIGAGGGGVAGSRIQRKSCVWGKRWH